jgi:hypothetical protein
MRHGRRLSTLKEAPEPMALMDGRGTGKATISGRSPCQALFYHTSEPLNCANVHAAAATRRHRVDNASCPCHTWAAILAGAAAAVAHMRAQPVVEGVISWKRMG